MIPPPHSEEPEALDTPDHAGFLLRFASHVIDTLLLTVIVVPILLIVFGPAYFLPPELKSLVDPSAETAPPAWWHQPVDIFFNYILPAAAVITFWVWKSATPGKMILRLAIVDARTLGRLTPGQAILRYLAYIPAMLPLFLGFFWVIWDPNKQGWHDKIAGTYVVIRPPVPK